MILLSILAICVMLIVYSMIVYSIVFAEKVCDLYRWHPMLAWPVFNSPTYLRVMGSVGLVFVTCMFAGLYHMYFKWYFAQ